MRDHVDQDDYNTLQGEVRRAEQHRRAAYEQLAETQREIEDLLERARTLLHPIPPMENGRMSNSTLLNAGSDAPDFTALTDAGETMTLSELRGKNVLLMFYPVDDTSGCTRQMCAARDEGAEYAAAEVLRFGVNDGDAASHGRFVEKNSLDFPLLVDEGGEIAAKYGTLSDTGQISRSTFLIDRRGRIVFAAPGAHGAAQVLEGLGA